jgi:hypothetical protein
MPQMGQRGWTILDLSFPVRRPPSQKRKKRQMGEAVQQLIDESTNKLTPTEPVHKISQVLPRPFHFMAAIPADQEIRSSKVDLSDGFWRLCIDSTQKWNFCHVMPDPPGSRARIVVPSPLQMGWALSPAHAPVSYRTSGVGLDDSKNGPLEQQHVAPVLARPNLLPRQRHLCPHGNPSNVFQCWDPRRKLVSGSDVPWLLGLQVDGRCPISRPAAVLYS